MVSLGNQLYACSMVAPSNLPMVLPILMVHTLPLIVARGNGVSVVLIDGFMVQ